jgi:salicylate 5-hydroxylase large subunit
MDQAVHFNRRAVWRGEGASRVPFWAYTDSATYRTELERIFYGPHWGYVALEAEIPNVGDFRLSWVGERGVIVVRDRLSPRDRADGACDIRVVENRCAHLGVRFCQQPMATHAVLYAPACLAQRAACDEESAS